MLDSNYIINKMESKKDKRMSVAQRLQSQMDLLTGDKKPVSELFLHQPLIPLPPAKLTKSQIMNLYD